MVERLRQATNKYPPPLPLAPIVAPLAWRLFTVCFEFHSEVGAHENLHFSFICVLIFQVFGGYVTGIMEDEDNPKEERLDSVCEILSGATEEVRTRHVLCVVKRLAATSIMMATV